jgi:hypothetical protein
MPSGQTRYGAEVLRVPAVHKNGRFSIAFNVVLLPSPTATRMRSPPLLAMRLGVGTRNANVAAG